MDESKYWFEQAPIGKAIVHMAVPMVLGMAAMCVYNFADTLFIGLLQDTASLAAVSLCLPFSALLMSVAELFGVGGSTLMARSLGASKGDVARCTASVMLWGSVAAALLIAVLAFLFPQTIAAFLGASGETLIPTAAYLQVMGMGAPFMIGNLVLGQQLRAIGASKESMAGMIGSALLNIALDPLFILGFGWGVSGAAFATVLSNMAAVLYYLLCIRKAETISLRLTDAHLPLSDLASFFKIGSSAMLLSLLMAASSLAFNSCAMAYGDAVVAAFGISQSIVQLIELVAMGLSEGVVPLVAAAYGAGNGTRIKGIVKCTALSVLVYCLLAGIACFVFREALVGLFSSDPTVLLLGGSILTAQLIAVLFASESVLITGCFQAFDAGTAANAMSIVRGGAIIPLVFLGSALFGEAGLIWSLFAAEAVSFLVGCLLFAKSKGRFSTSLRQATQRAGASA